MSEGYASKAVSVHRARVLVVDDDALVRQAIQWALEDEGLAVVMASGGREAIAAAAEQRPDVVVLDFTLPEINGHEVAASLRAGRLGPLPILLITADGQAPAKAAQTGAYAFLRKPFLIEELVEKVHEGLNGLGEA